MILAMFIVVVSLALGGLAGNAQTQTRKAFRERRASRWQRRGTDLNSAGASVIRARGQAYTLVKEYKGQDFINEFDFYVGQDPTHGKVNYVSREDAVLKRLVYVQEDNTTVIAVDDTTWLPPSANRDSVRISTKDKFDSGLFIADIWAMPHGCSVWPAYWSVGPDWPNKGEIDILEGVHDQPVNQYTVHTGPNCTLTTGSLSVSGKMGGTQCASSNGDNAGCSFTDTDLRSYGQGFNQIAGGVFAHLLDADGIKIWHFPRTEIPADIAAGSPDPAGWGPPVGYWSSSTCDMVEHFQQHSLVINITLCGDWGDPTFSGAGCPGTCAEMVADPRNYLWAKWKLNSISVYN